MSETSTTLEKIHDIAKRKFIEKGYKSTPLREIVREAGMTTGAFYGYYKSKEELFESLVGRQYDYVMDTFKEVLDKMHERPLVDQYLSYDGPLQKYMLHVLRYAYDNKEAFYLLLKCSEGTKYENFINELVVMDIEAAKKYIAQKEENNIKVNHLDKELAYMVITGMFHTFFAVLTKDIPYEEAESYAKQMVSFNIAGFKEILGENA